MPRFAAYANGSPNTVRLVLIVTDDEAITIGKMDRYVIKRDGIHVSLRKASAIEKGCGFTETKEVEPTWKLEFSTPRENSPPVAMSVLQHLRIGEGWLAGDIPPIARSLPDKPKSRTMHTPAKIPINDVRDAWKTLKIAAAACNAVSPGSVVLTPPRILFELD